MVNALRTGAYISRLRKDKDWTQLDLAEKLHVTHQAVSQWEKGAAFPDIGLLPPLARLLGVSVDDLLSGEPQRHARRVSPGIIVEGFARGNPREIARLVSSEPEGVDAMLEAAPMARPSQLNEVVANLDGLRFTLEQAVQLAPFVSAEALDSLLAGAGDDQVDGDILGELAPFLSHETLDRLAQRYASDEVTFERVTNLAPFLGKDTLKRLVDRVLATGGPLQREHLTDLAPFLDKATLEGLLQRFADEAMPIDDIVDLAPFVSREALTRLVERLDDPALVAEHLENLAPFLGAEGLKQALAHVKGGVTADLIISLAPFLDKATLEGLLKKNVKSL